MKSNLKITGLLCLIPITIAIIAFFLITSEWVKSVNKTDYSNIPSAANVEIVKIGRIDMPSVGNNEIYQITLEDGTECVILLGGYRGGISCNWQAKEEVGCSADETEEMGYGEPDEDHNAPLILNKNWLTECVKQEDGSFWCSSSEKLKLWESSDLDCKKNLDGSSEIDCSKDPIWNDVYWNGVPCFGEGCAWNQDCIKIDERFICKPE